MIKKIFILFCTTIVLAADSQNTLNQLTTEFEQGILLEQNYIKHIAQVLFEPQTLPTQYKISDQNMLKCATPYTNLLMKNAHKLSRQDQMWLNAVMARPKMSFSYDTPEGHFKIHYDTSGENAIYQPNTDMDGDDIPDYINRIGRYMEESRQLLVDSLGYLPPPPDNGRGGDDRYDVYMEAYPGALGVTFFEESSSYYPGHNDYITYIQLLPNYSPYNSNPEDLAFSTATHEYFHAIQAGYDSFEDPWIMEVSSTWIEDIILDDFNDHYNWLSYFFREPHLSITTFNGTHEYASCVWAFHLAEKFGRDIIHTIWDGCVNDQVFNATDKVLKTHDSSLEQEFAEFTQWNYLTNFRANTNLAHYEEAENFPPIGVYATHEFYPVENTSPAKATLPDHFGSNYIRFKNDTTQNAKLFVFNGNPIRNWQLKALAWIADDYVELEPEFTSKSEAQLIFPEYFQELVVIPSVTSRFGSKIDYTYLVKTFSSRDLFIDLQSTEIFDKNVQDNNDRLEAGEQGSLRFQIKNYGTVLTNVSATLRCDNPAIELVDSTATFISILNDAQTSNTLDPITFNIKNGIEPQNIECTLVFSTNGKTAEFPVSFLVGYPSFLIVDQNTNSNDFRVYYDVLDSLGILYDTMQSNSNDATVLHMDERETVVWMSGFQQTLNNSEKIEIENHIKNGKNIILMGENLGLDKSDSTFFQNSFGAQFSGETTSGMLQGVTGEYISNGQFAGFIDTMRDTVKETLIAVNGGLPVFNYINEESLAAVAFDGDHKSVLFSFQLHHLRDNHHALAKPQDIFARTLAWFNGNSGILDQPKSQPNSIELLPNYPNPFNGTTRISYSVSQKSLINIAVYNIFGQRVKTLVNNVVPSGSYHTQWNGTNSSNVPVSSGTYLIRLETTDKTLTQKALYLK